MVVDHVLKFIDTRFVGAGSVTYSPAEACFAVAVIQVCARKEVVETTIEGSWHREEGFVV